MGFASQPNVKWPIAHWLSENMCSFSMICLSLPVVFVCMCFTANFMATNSPKSKDPQELTGCFNKIGSVWPGGKIQAPAPHGPGFPKQDPSVKAIAVVSLQFSNILPISSLDRASCIFVLDLTNLNSANILAYFYLAVRILHMYTLSPGNATEFQYLTPYQPLAHSSSRMVKSSSLPVLSP